MKLLFSFLVFIGFTCFSQTQLNNTLSKFEVWKTQALETLNIECEQITDDFYEKECAVMKNDLLSADINLIDSVFQASIGKYVGERPGKLQMEYYLRYNYSGEYNDVWDIFVFRKEKGFFVTKYSHYKKVLSVNDVKRLDKTIFNSKTREHEEDLLCSHSFILTKFHRDTPKETSFVLCPHISYLDKINYLTE